MTEFKLKSGKLRDVPVIPQAAQASAMLHKLPTASSDSLSAEKGKENMTELEKDKCRAGGKGKIIEIGNVHVVSQQQSEIQATAVQVGSRPLFGDKFGEVANISEQKAMVGRLWGSS